MSGSLIGSCLRKNRYPSEEIALSVLARCEAERPGTTLHHYACALCGGWHLGKAGAQLLQKQRQGQLLVERKQLRRERGGMRSQLSPHIREPLSAGHRAWLVDELARVELRLDAIAVELDALAGGVPDPQITPGK